MISPAQGACRQSLSGSMASPGPMAPLANTASSTSASGNTGPLNGALRVMLFLLCMALYSSVGTGDFAQVARLVGVHATGHGQVGGHHVETLDRKDRVEGRMFGATQVQVAFGHVRRCCQQHPGTALAHLGGELEQPG